MYELDDVSPLLNAIRRHDILKDRQSELDLDVTRFHSLENIYETFQIATANTPYEHLNETTRIAVLGGIKPVLKTLVYRFIVRTKEMKGESPESSSQKQFFEYIQYLYYQNSGDVYKRQIQTRSRCGSSA